ncbi:MAG: pitrilysin family protein [Bacteroidota bacterium]
MILLEDCDGEQPLKGGAYQSVPPMPGIPKTTAFPQYFETTIANGLRLLVIEHHSLPIVSLRLVIRNGSLYDGSLPGLASMTGELLTKGTASRTAREIAEEIDFVGGQLASGSDWDANFVTLNILREHLDTGLCLMEDIALHPTFPHEEIDRLRDQRIATLLQKQDDPGFLADRVFAETVYDSHPYARQILGTKKSLTELHRDDLVQFHSTAYVPNNAILAVAGDISPVEAVDKVLAMCEKWKRKDIFPTRFPEISPMRTTQVVVVDKPGAVQSAIRMGHVGIARKSDDYIRTYVLNTLFGGYFQSRINQNLREAHGYTYGANSLFDARQYEGPFTVSVDVRNEVTDSAISEILYEMRRICTERIDESELSTVKSYIIGSLPLQIETPSQIASRAISIELYGLPKTFYSTLNENVAAITAIDLQDMAEKYFHPDTLAIIIAGDAKVVESLLKKFGSVTVIDAEGNLLSAERIK